MLTNNSVQHNFAAGANYSTESRNGNDFGIAPRGSNSTAQALQSCDVKDLSWNEIRKYARKLGMNSTFGKTRIQLEEFIRSKEEEKANPKPELTKAEKLAQENELLSKIVTEQKPFRTNSCEWINDSGEFVIVIEEFSLTKEQARALDLYSSQKVWGKAIAPTFPHNNNCGYKVRGHEQWEAPVYSYKLDRYSTLERGNAYILSHARLEEPQTQPQKPEPIRKPLTNKEIKQKITHCEIVRKKRQPDTGKYDKKDQRIWVWKFQRDFFTLLRDDGYGYEEFHLDDYFGDSFDVSTEKFRYEWDSENQILSITVFKTPPANSRTKQALDNYLSNPWREVGVSALNVLNNSRSKSPNPLTPEEQLILRGCERISRQLKIAKDAGKNEYREVVSDQIWGILRQPEVAPGVWEARFPKNTPVQGVKDWVAHVIKDNNGFRVKEGAYQAEEFDFEDQKFNPPQKPALKPALTNNPPINLDREPDITTDKGRFWIEPIANHPGVHQVVRIKPKGEVSSHIVSSHNECDCQGFGYRHHCCHLDAMVKLAPTFEALYARLGKGTEYCINQKLDCLFQEILGDRRVGSLNIPELITIVESLESLIACYQEFQKAFVDLIATNKTSEYFQKVAQPYKVSEMTTKQLAKATAIAHQILNEKSLPKVA